MRDLRQRAAARTQCESLQGPYKPPLPAKPAVRSGRDRWPSGACPRLHTLLAYAHSGSLAQGAGTLSRRRSLRFSWMRRRAVSGLRPAAFARITRPQPQHEATRLAPLVCFCRRMASRRPRCRGGVRVPSLAEPLRQLRLGPAAAGRDPRHRPTPAAGGVANHALYAVLAVASSSASLSIGAVLARGQSVQRQWHVELSAQRTHLGVQ